jgi:hypothetical protein
MRHHLSRVDVADMGISVYTHRLGASLAFEALRRWKVNIETARGASNPNPAVQGTGTEQPRTYTGILGSSWVTEAVTVLTFNSSGRAIIRPECRLGLGGPLPETRLERIHGRF